MSSSTFCKFCSVVHTGIETIDETEHLVIIPEIAPVSPGHLLILSREHFEDAFMLNADIWRDFSIALASAKEYIQKFHSPNGYNIGMNCGVAAGQSQFHFHAHVIPRYTNDIDDPEGGICNMFKDTPKRHH